MDATITRLPVKTPQPAPWNAGNPTAILIAEALHSGGFTPAEAFREAARHPEYQPVAEALERVAEASRDMIRAASRR